MFDPGLVLETQIDTILNDWIQAIRQDRKIESSIALSNTALGDGIPKLLKSMVSVLSYSESEEYETVIKASLEHGIVRARQGYDSAEIAREYCLLRQVIFKNLESEILIGSPQEIIRAFRLIDSVLDEAISQCFQSYVEERLQELEQLQSQLTLNNQQLNRLLDASKDHLSYLAHELKTPLTSVIGYSELLLKLQQKPTNLDKNSLDIRSIERVLQGGRHLLHIINDALELSRYEAGQIQLNVQDVKIKGIIDTVLEMIEPLAQVKDLEIRLDCDRAPSQVVTDSFRFQQILTNLLSNAIKYTDNGFIEVKCETLPDELWLLSIIDTGIGIATPDQVNVFEPYARVFSEKRYSQDGTGLGLAIVARLVKLLQGEITLVSQEGVGSTFTITLPLRI